MSLSEKVIRLKMNAAKAWRQASWWQKVIEERGEDAAIAFYTHLGLNHLEAKSVEYDGLTLRREPRDSEKVAIKGVHTAQESAKESITKILLKLREDLISDGLKGIKKLKPATYHELTLQASPESRQSLRDRLIKTYRQGRSLVAAEIGDGSGKSHTHDWALNEPFQCLTCLFVPESKAADEDEFDELDTLTDVTDSRVANDVQSRITAAATRFALLGLVGAALIAAIQQEMADGSLGYIDRAAAGAANKVINIGRSDEAQNRKSDWGRIEYSSILDANCCDICAAADGQESEDGSGLDPAPNPDCLGTDQCRCFWVYIAEGTVSA